MKQDINFDSFTDEELDILIKMQEEKIKDVKDKLKKELNHLKELIQKMNK